MDADFAVQFMILMRVGKPIRASPSLSDDSPALSLNNGCFFTGPVALQKLADKNNHDTFEP